MNHSCDFKRSQTIRLSNTQSADRLLDRMLVARTIDSRQTLQIIIRLYFSHVRCHANKIPHFLEYEQSFKNNFLSFEQNIRNKKIASFECSKNHSRLRLEAIVLEDIRYPAMCTWQKHLSEPACAEGKRVSTFPSNFLIKFQFLTSKINSTICGKQKSLKPSRQIW